jgi:hypothetical protein
VRHAEVTATKRMIVRVIGCTERALAFHPWLVGAQALERSSTGISVWFVAHDGADETGNTVFSLLLRSKSVGACDVPSKQVVSLPQERQIGRRGSSSTYPRSLRSLASLLATLWLVPVPSTAPVCQWWATSAQATSERLLRLS